MMNREGERIDKEGDEERTEGERHGEKNSKYRNAGIGGRDRKGRKN